MVCITLNVIPNRVIACICALGDTCGILAVLGQAVNHRSACRFTYADEILRFADVGQRIGGRSCCDYRCCLSDGKVNAHGLAAQRNRSSISACVHGFAGKGFAVLGKGNGNIRIFQRAGLRNNELYTSSVIGLAGCTDSSGANGCLTLRAAFGDNIAACGVGRGVSLDDGINAHRTLEAVCAIAVVGGGGVGAVFVVTGHAADGAGTAHPVMHLVQYTLVKSVQAAVPSAGHIHGGQRAAVRKRVICNTGHAGGDGNGGQRCTARECPHINGRHTRRDGHRSQCGAVIECVGFNGCHTRGDGDGGQRLAAAERRTSNLLHTVGDGDSSKILAAVECFFANLGHGGGDGVSLYFYVRTAVNQGGFILVKQHAVFIRGIVEVILSHGDLCRAIPKSTLIYGGHGRRNRHRCEIFAFAKRPITDGCKSLGQGDALQRAPKECPAFDGF